MESPQSARILVVDDEVAQMKALCDTLRDQGYDVVGFDTGKAALAALRHAKFDLLLSDLMMPEMGGIVLLQTALKADPDMVGVIMTGAGTIDTAVEAMKTGALDYILKPFKLSALLPVVSRALAMRSLRLENADLAQRLRERADELEAVNRELEAFSYSVSHDLRAPLRVIDGYCGIIEETLGDRLGEDGDRLFGIVRDSGRKMGQLIEDLLTFSKLGRKPMNAARIDMNSLVDEVWLEIRAGQTAAALEFKMQPLSPAFGDRALVKQVWMNLLANAVKYSAKRDGPAVEVCAKTQGSVVNYCVKDNGAGFDMRYAAKLFGVFQRLHSEAEFPGTGIGLAIVQRVVTRHGGRVWAEGNVGKGAAFFFSLPGDDAKAIDG